MANEKFCLRWNDFESNIGVAFRELREDQEFFDVTLACDEDQIQAHKVILSMSHCQMLGKFEYGLPAKF